MAKRSDDPWTQIQLPNAGSKLATPASLKIDLHYARLRIWERWDWERFVRLAKFLQITPVELASLACLPHRDLENFQKRNRLFIARRKNVAAALVLTLIEAHCCTAFTKDVLENPFPDLNAMGTSS